MFWIFLLLLLTSPALRSEDVYRVAFAQDLEQVKVEACFDGAPPHQLYRSHEAGRFSTVIHWDNGEIRSPVESERVRLPELPANTCLNWQVDLAEAVKKLGYRSVLRLEDSLVTNGSLWFWRDMENRPIRVEVTLPEAYSISTPWVELPASGDQLAFRVNPTPASWSFRIAVGRFPLQRIPIAGSELRVAFLGGLKDEQRTALGKWIGVSADSVASVFGYFPSNNPQILIIAAGRQSDAVPWAHVLRGGGTTVEFYIDEERPSSEFNSHWTATHEFSHMLLPYIASRDRWLSEGLASYYQNVLRARDGRLTKQQAWKKLHAGFERGKAATQTAGPGESLAAATQSGRSATMRVYWSGAAMMLQADARLRSLSQGIQSLDTALAALHGCCFDAARRWRAREVFTQLDRLTGFTVFSDLYRENVMSQAFPDLSKTYELLGVVITDDSIQLDPDAPWSHIRHLIMNQDSVQDSQPKPGNPTAVEDRREFEHIIP